MVAESEADDEVLVGSSSSQSSPESSPSSPSSVVVELPEAEGAGALAEVPVGSVSSQSSLSSSLSSSSPVVVELPVDEGSDAVVELPEADGSDAVVELPESDGSDEVVELSKADEFDALVVELEMSNDQIQPVSFGSSEHTRFSPVQLAMVFQAELSHPSCPWLAITLHSSRRIETHWLKRNRHTSKCLRYRWSPDLNLNWRSGEDW